MAINVGEAKTRIIDALGDLYRIVQDKPGMSESDRQLVRSTIKALEAEYLALLGFNDGTGYTPVTDAFRVAEGKLEEIRKERERLASVFSRAEKILNSMTRVLMLF